MYRGVIDVYQVTKEFLMKLGRIVAVVGGPLCEDFSKKRLLPDYNGNIPETDPRPGLNGPKGRTFRQAISIIRTCLELNPDCKYFIENVVFDDMPEHWNEVCKALGEPLKVNSKDYSF